LSGKDKIRPFWRFYSQDAKALIFVVDSSDRDRVGMARNELLQMINVLTLEDAPVLVFANKQDLGNAMGPEEVADRLDLHSLMPHRLWRVQGSKARAGCYADDGLYEGLEWLEMALK
jgi:ADP-ribosylation factor protein 1